MANIDSTSNLAPRYLITAQTLRSRLNDESILLLDAREPEKYGKGHIPGAVSLPPSSMEWSVPVSSDAEVHHLLAPVDRISTLLKLSGIRRDSRIILYDEGGSYAAARLFWILDYCGHSGTAVLDGGLSNWQAIGGDMVTRPSRQPWGDFVPSPDQGKIADFDMVRSLQASPDSRQDIVLVNALPRAAFEKEAIPGSVNVPYTETFEFRNTHRLRRAEELAELLNNESISPDREVILYCGIGYTASQLYLVARLLGYPKVRLYDGSLTDWKARGGRLEPGR